MMRLLRVSATGTLKLVSVALPLSLCAGAVMAQQPATPTKPTQPPAAPTASTQPSAAAARSTASTGSYVVSGALSDADLDRLVAALKKLKTVEQVELTKVPGAVVLYVRGAAQGTVLLTAARTAGFELRQMPVRLYVAHGLSHDADSAPLRAALENLPGVEQVEMEAQAAGVALRIRSVASATALAGAAKTAGFTLQMVSAYVASGSSAEADLIRLHEVVAKLAGFESLDIRMVSGGAMLLLHGTVQEKELTIVARSAGYALLPVSDSAENTRQFRVQGVTDAPSEAKLRSALNGLPGMGAIRIRSASEGTRLGITNGTAALPLIIAKAESAGFVLLPMETVAVPTLDTDGERITPPAPGERTLEEITNVGEIAPDFTLIMHDGKSKVTLSDYRGKKPVVLIFGSYT